MKVAIIGFGKVGYHLSKAFLDNDVNLNSIFNRSEISKPAFLDDSIKVLDNLNDLPDDTEVVILSISDDQISKIAGQLPKVLKKNAIVAHTSGIHGIGVFDDSIEHKAAFYPLNSFSKDAAISWSETPIFITSELEEDMARLMTLAEFLSPKVYHVDDDQKAVLHTAAVFVNNFSNALFQMGHRIMKENNLEFEALIPLIQTTLEKIQSMSPEEAQTGPASRGDLQTINKHYEILEGFPFEKQVYQLLTHYINPKIQDHYEND